jgi:hypothetical protein
MDKPTVEGLMDDDGENRAVRCFLMQYGVPGLTTGAMRKHMERCGFSHWPEWVTEQDGEHLTKGGAQHWLRHLFALEAAERLCAPSASAPLPKIEVELPDGDTRTARVVFVSKTEKGYSACIVVSTPSASAAVPEGLKDACAPFLKDGETPAECIARNRKDAEAVFLYYDDAQRWRAVRELLGEIETEFVRLEDLPAWIRKMQDSLREARAAAAPSAPVMEPVAWMHEYEDPFTKEHRMEASRRRPTVWELQPNDKVYPLYASPVPEVANKEGEQG